MTTDGRSQAQNKQPAVSCRRSIEELFMAPQLIEKPQIVLAGFSFFGNPFATHAGWTEENEIGRLWNRFMDYCGKHPTAIKHMREEHVAYELHIEHAETKQTGEYEVFVGVQVEIMEDVPVEISIKLLPATLYAVFTLHGKEITSDWNRTIGDWMQQAGYHNPYKYGFQYYDERFKGVDRIEESLLDVYVPIMKTA
jgi:AraC family transcriptional regulator